jgi:hypothetical protein
MAWPEMAGHQLRTLINAHSNRIQCKCIARLWPYNSAAFVTTQQCIKTICSDLNILMDLSIIQKQPSLGVQEYLYFSHELNAHALRPAIFTVHNIGFRLKFDKTSPLIKLYDTYRNKVPICSDRFMRLKG